MAGGAQATVLGSEPLLFLMVDTLVSQSNLSWSYGCFCISIFEMNGEKDKLFTASEKITETCITIVILQAFDSSLIFSVNYTFLFQDVFMSSQEVSQLPQVHK